MRTPIYVLAALLLACASKPEGDIDAGADTGSGSDGDSDADADGDADTDADGDTDTDTESCVNLIDWIEIEGGSFMMGADDMGPSTIPVHEVAVESFGTFRGQTLPLAIYSPAD